MLHGIILCRLVFFFFQQVQLYNAYAAWASVQQVLRCSVLSASFPNGTDSSYFTTACITGSVFKPAEEILFKYFSLRNDETKYEGIQPCH